MGTARRGAAPPGSREAGQAGGPPSPLHAASRGRVHSAPAGQGAPGMERPALAARKPFQKLLAPGGRGRHSSHKSEFTAAVTQRVVPQHILSDTAGEKPRWAEPPGPSLSTVCSNSNACLTAATVIEASLLKSSDLENPCLKHSRNLALQPRSRPTVHAATGGYRNPRCVSTPTRPVYPGCPPPPPTAVKGFSEVGSHHQRKDSDCVSSEQGAGACGRTGRLYWLATPVRDKGILAYFLGNTGTWWCWLG